MNLTQKKLKAAADELMKAGSGEVYLPKLSKTATRYDLVKQKLTKQAALQKRLDAVSELVDELKCLLERPLDKYDFVYKKLKRGSRRWKQQEKQPVFPLICSEEVSRSLVGKIKKKK